jgi:hypothetical protein
VSGVVLGQWMLAGAVSDTLCAGASPAGALAAG